MSNTEDKIRNRLEDCGALLGELSATCCKPARSQSMNELLSTFAMFRDRIEHSSGSEMADACIEMVCKSGSSIGRLHVSCCTPAREKIYQQLLKKLNGLYLLSWQVKGHDH